MSGGHNGVGKMEGNEGIKSFCLVYFSWRGCERIPSYPDFGSSPILEDLEGRKEDFHNFLNALTEMSR